MTLKDLCVSMHFRDVPKPLGPKPGGLCQDWTCQFCVTTQLTPESDNTLRHDQYGLLVANTICFTDLDLVTLWPSPFTLGIMWFKYSNLQNPGILPRSTVSGFMLNIASQDNILSRSYLELPKVCHFKATICPYSTWTCWTFSALHPKTILGELQHISTVYQKNSPFGHHWSTNNSANHKATISQLSKNRNWYCCQYDWSPILCMLCDSFMACSSSRTYKTLQIDKYTQMYSGYLPKVKVVK